MSDTNSSSCSNCVRKTVQLDKTSRKLKTFWRNMSRQVRSLKKSEVTSPNFPVEQTKEIMKLEEHVQRVRDEAAAVLAKAAEIFVQEMTLRCWMATRDSGRRVLQINDMALVVDNYHQFSFLVDIVPPSTKTTSLLE